MGTNGHQGQNGQEGRLPGERRRRRLLIVEDERVLRETVARFFESRGMEVARAGSLSEAHAWLERGGFDVLLLDVGLPDGDGLSLLRRTPAERALVVSANPDPKRYERMGVVHSLPKPLDMLELAERVETLAAHAA